MLYRCVYLLVACLVSCQGQNPTSDGAPMPKLTVFPIATQIDTVYLPNAPSGITRNIRNDPHGNLLFANYKIPIIYNDTLFSPIPIDGWDQLDAFDALEDRHGNYWIASTHHGLFCYNGTSLKGYMYGDGPPHHRIMSLYEDRAGRLWIATRGGVSCYNGTTFNNYTTEDGLPKNDVNVILEDHQGNFWFGTRGALCLYRPSDTTFTILRGTDGVALINSKSIIEDQHQRIWVGDYGGLWRCHEKGCTQVASAPTLGICEDQHGHLWTTSPDGALTVYDAQTLHQDQPLATEVFRSHKMCFGLTEDKMGRIWVGTLDGVWRYDDGLITYFR